MASITSAGIGSGIDIEGLITQLVAAEGQSRSFGLNNKEAVLQADLSALGTLKSALNDFQGSVKALGELKDFQARKAASSDTDLFTVTADTSAVAGSYDIETVQIAQAHKLRSGDFTSESEVVGTGSLTISLGSDSFQVVVDSNNNTLAGIRDAINENENNQDLTASIINVDSGARLVLTSSKTGASNTISIAVSDDDLNDSDNLNLSRLATANLTTINPAQDAVINVDQQQVTRSSNDFSDVIEGVTISVLKASPGTTETLTVELNKDSVKGKVNSFVKAYNSLVDTMKELSSFNAETGEAGVLLGDSTLRGVQNQLRRTISNPVQGLDFSTLAEIGVTTDDTGHLKVDSSKLDNVMASDFESVSQLFASDEGVAKQLNSVLDGYLASDGLLPARTNGIQDRIKDISGQREKLNLRMTSLEARLRAQFTAMDRIVSQLRNTSTFLSQQLDSLPGAIKPKTN